jgi:hypothetical protein
MGRKWLFPRAKCRTRPCQVVEAEVVAREAEVGLEVVGVEVGLAGVVRVAAEVAAQSVCSRPLQNGPMHCRWCPLR